MESAAVGSPMSAVPQVSEFWYADGTNGSKILTCHNFFLGRVPLSVSSVYSAVPVSAQLELFPSGDYIARSNLVERYYKRVNPDDWDGDLGSVEDELTVVEVRLEAMYVAEEMAEA